MSSAVAALAVLTAGSDPDTAQAIAIGGLLGFAIAFAGLALYVVVRVIYTLWWHVSTSETAHRIHRFTMTQAAREAYDKQQAMSWMSVCSHVAMIQPRVPEDDDSQGPHAQ